MKVRHIKSHRCRTAIARWLQNVHGFLREAKQLSNHVKLKGGDGVAEPQADRGVPDGPRSDDEFHRLVRSRAAMKGAAIPVDLDDL